jgi:hypothetical protein
MIIISIRPDFYNNIAATPVETAQPFMPVGLDGVFEGRKMWRAHSERRRHPAIGPSALLSTRHV